MSIHAMSRIIDGCRKRDEGISSTEVLLRIDSSVVCAEGRIL
jgi:hypothetical protein